MEVNLDSDEKGLYAQGIGVSESEYSVFNYIIRLISVAPFTRCFKKYNLIPVSKNLDTEISHAPKYNENMDVKGW